MRRIGWWFLSVMAAAGCSSTPVHYYTLTPSPPRLANPVGEKAPGIDISAPRMPAQINRPELVVRRGNEELVLLDNEQWGSALGEEIRNALHIALLDDLAKPGAATVRGFSKISIKLDIGRFDSMPNHYDAIDATWWLSVSGADMPTLAISCPFNSRLPIAVGNAAMVAGYQQQLKWLADDISAALQTAASPLGPVCPNSRNSH